nr:Hpt domain-containing protein [Lautropia sp.]
VQADTIKDDDRELLDIFLVEAGEVLAAIQESLQQSRAAPADNRPLTTIRRAFHTLKGSSRMVGLAKFGEAGWAFEQVLNKWLSEDQPGTGRLFELIEAGHGLFSVWLAALHRDPSAVIECESLVAQCEALREGREYVEKAEPLLPLDPVKQSFTGLPAMAEVAADEPALQAPAQITVRELSVEDLEAFVEADDEFVVASDEPADPELDLLPSSTEAAAAHLEMADTASLRAWFDAEAEAGTDAEAEAGADAEATADAEAESAAQAEAESVAEGEASDEKTSAEKTWIGLRSIDAQLFEIFNAEAAETRERLDAELAGWRERRELSAPESLVRALHSLVGTSRHVGLLQLRAIAEPAEQFLLNHAKAARPLPADHLALLYAAIASINSMLDQFSRHIEPQRDAQSERAMMDLAFQWSNPESVVEPVDADRSVRGEALRKKAAQVLGAARQAVEVEHDVYHGLFDEIDPDLGPVFFEETDDLLPQIDKGLHQWRAHPAEEASPNVLMRLLHTIKGSARMAGAMRFGQMIHELETRVEEAIELPEVPETLVDQLVAQYDQAFAAYEELKEPGEQSQPAAGGIFTVPAAVAGTVIPAGMDKAGDAAGAKTRQPAPPLPAQSAGTEVTPAKRVAAAGASAASLSVHAELDAQLMAGAAQAAAAAQQVIRVRADVLDRMVSESGEVSVARARLDSEMAVIRQSLGELTENVNRLRGQLREIEIQADNQVQAQIAHAKDARADFDPLEFDRYTRFQELTKMLAESVNDVATVQQNALRSVEAATQDLARQGQVSRSLQQNLMRIRMVQFSTITDRLYRVVRQAAKDADKRVVMELKGGNAEIDRSVLERMAAPMEHLLRNSVAHGIETRVDRIAAGKPETGELVVAMRQEGNEVIMSFADDGAGLDYARIEQRARERGLLPEGRKPTVRELAQLIFAPGFSTALEVTALSGRGIGMDVVRAEVSAMGGRIDIDASPGVGTCFTIHLPVSLAVSQVVLLAVDQAKFAVQAALVEQILQVKPEVLAAAYESHSIECDGEAVPMYFLGSLLELPQSRPIAQRQSPVVIVRAGSSRIALHVDRVVPNQEVVIKNVGPQLARLSGIAGATILGNGDIVLILNPVQLALASIANQAGEGDTAHFAATDIAATATVMVVDDSVTVRKVTQRLLVREGYTVLLAKDGVDALRQLQDVVPDMMLVDIEMPRMDGFDLTKNVRATERLQHIPIIMITSRTADKHRNHAFSLGVDAFLGKPYPEDELLRHVRGFATQRRTERTW